MNCRIVHEKVEISRTSAALLLDQCRNPGEPPGYCLPFFRIKTFMLEIYHKGKWKRGLSMSKSGPAPLIPLLVTSLCLN